MPQNRERQHACIIQSPRSQAPPSLDGTAEADVIARSVFSSKAIKIGGLDYAIEYHLADGYAGGDVVDAYEFDNKSIAFTAVDVEGRGAQQASAATLVKFSLRAFASAGMTPEAAIMHLNRLYIDHCTFERTPSFASAFFAHADAERRTMGYASAGHEVACLLRPNEPAKLLPVTAPLIGIFADQHVLFGQRYIELLGGSVFVLATDGITEARNAQGELFGTGRFLDVVNASGRRSMDELTTTLVDEALAFAGGAVHDDIAVLAARFVSGGG